MFSVRSRLVVAGVVLMGLSQVTLAEPVKRALPACVSEDLLDEMTTYSVKGDKAGMMELLTSGKCTILRAGETVSVISPGFMVATIRYRGTKLFTPSEAIR